MHLLFSTSLLSSFLLLIPSSAGAPSTSSTPSTQPATAKTSQLFAAQSDGRISTLLLTEHDGDNKTSSLVITSVTHSCGANPSTLSLDSQNRLLYCLDRGLVPGGTSGSLHSLRIGLNGSLTRIASVSAPYSGVGAQFFDDEDTGVRGYVSASYVGGKVGVYRFPDRDGGLAEPSQVLVMNTTHVGPVVERQDKSYLHDVILDPTRAFLLMTDLGQDRVRVFRYHKQDIAPLVELAPLITPPGCGPRKAVFWTKKETGEVFLFVNGELDQRVYSYRVEYKQGGLEWCLVGSVVSVSEELPKTTAPTSGIAVTPDGRFVIVSNREVSFAASPIHRSGSSDTLSVFSINANGTLTPVQQAPSGGYLPRHFMINTDGDKIAVGHQDNSTVVIWKRNVETGKIVSEEEGGKLGVVQLSGPVVFTQWDA